MYARLDGKLLLEESGARWRDQEGTAPFALDIRCPVDLANELFSKAQRDGSKLEIVAPEIKQRFTAKRLSIIGTSPTDNPYENFVNVVDRRFFWEYKHVYRAFNVPRRSGARRRIGSEVPSAAQQIVDDIAFKPYSLKDGLQAWTTEEVIIEIMDAVAGRRGRDWDDQRVLGFVNLPEITDGLIIDANGQAAIGQMLAELGGGIGIYLDRDGKAILYNRLDESERELFGLPKSKIQTRTADGKLKIIGEGYFAEQDRKLERPESVEVLFERLIELRVDSKEQGAGAATTTTVARNDVKPAPTAVDVLRAPEDFTFEGREIIVGQWIEVDFYLRFLVGKQPGGLPNLTRQIINELWTSNNGLEYYADLDQSGLWELRIGTIRDHYRLFFQIEKRWRDRLASIRARRAVVQDYETGTFGSSPVFVDYAVERTWRADASLQGAKAAQEAVTNVFANPQGLAKGPIVGTPYIQLRPSMATVGIEDEDQGIFFLQFGRGNDTSYRTRNIFRSAIDPQNVPVDNTTKRQIWLQDGFLITDYELSTILSVTLGAPNDNRRYHVEKVSVREAVQKLPFPGVPDAQGPVYQVRVNPEVLQAYIAWQDSKRDQFIEAFAPDIGGQITTVAPGQNQNPQIDLGVPINQNQLREFALAVAARVYSSFHDSVEGDLGTGLDPKLSLRGRATYVEHAADSTVGAVTRVNVAPDAPQLDLFAVLPKSLRRIVEKRVQA